MCDGSKEALFSDAPLRLFCLFACLLESRRDIEVEKITLSGNQQLIDGVVRALSAASI
jgi:hypothetical protein